MLDIVLDGVLDTVKLLPYLFITFLVLELIEHKFSNKNEVILSKNKKYGPLFGGLLGAFPQCGFGVVASNLFSNKVITMGTLIAVFLSTSDEMLPIMISEKTNVLTLLKIIGFKVLIGISVGYIVDLLYRRVINTNKDNIHHMCEEEHCSCNEHGVIISSIIHTIKIALFIVGANIVINLIINGIGEENILNFLLNKSIISHFICSLVGLIPNCASSVIITKLYLSNLISIGNLFSGLLTGSGIGILLLFKTNKNIKENISIVTIIYFVGVLIGIIMDLFIK